MNKAQLVEMIAQKTRTTKSHSEAVLDATLEIIQNTLVKGDEVKLVGFGTFCKTSRKGRKARNPKTGDIVHIPDCCIPRFKPGKDFKERVSK